MNYIFYLLVVSPTSSDHWEIADPITTEIPIEDASWECSVSRTIKRPKGQERILVCDHINGGVVTTSAYCPTQSRSGITVHDDEANTSIDLVLFCKEDK